MPNSKDQQVTKPLALYSSARVVQITPLLQFVYISGTTARQSDGQVPPFGHSAPASDTMDSDGPTAAAIQTEFILDKIDALIYEASDHRGSINALVEVTIFVKNLARDYASVNEVYNKRMTEMFGDTSPLPARTCVEVSALPPDARTLVEIKGVAAI